MRALKTISIYRKLETKGSHPLLVACDDFQDYACKYCNGIIPVIRLTKELIAYEFLKLWDIKIPKSIIIEVVSEQIPQNIFDGFTKKEYFDIPSFGSLYLEQAIAVDEFVKQSPSSIKYKFKNFNDLMKISLFDLWVGNGDRNERNYNLILNPEEEGYYFYAIDNEMMFNAGFLDSKLMILSSKESLISSSLMKRFFPRNANHIPLINEVINGFNTDVKKCNLHLNDILSEIPIEWEVNIEELKSKMLEKLFSVEWLMEVKNHFKEHLRYSNII